MTRAVGAQFESDVPPGWIVCRGRAGTGAWSSRSASPGCSTGSRSRWSGPIGPVLMEPATLHLTAGQVGGTGTAYLAGAVSGALVFGRLTDLFGRKRLFLITLAVYLLATLASGLAWSFWSFAFFRCVCGAGIGGEASAVNSAIDELIPARSRGPRRPRGQQHLLAGDGRGRGAGAGAARPAGPAAGARLARRVRRRRARSGCRCS